MAKRDAPLAAGMRCAGSAKRVLHGPELRHYGRVASRRHNRGLGNLQSTRVGAVEPPANEILVIREQLHARVIGRLLIDGLPVESDDGQILRRGAGLPHERTSGLGIQRSGDIVQPTKFENKELVSERSEHLIGYFLGPRYRLPRNKPRPPQQTG